MQTLSFRIDEEDYNLLMKINKVLDENWEDVFCTPTSTSISQTLRTCIRRTYYELFEKESNK